MATATGGTDDPSPWLAAIALVEDLLALPEDRRMQALDAAAPSVEVRQLVERLLDADRRGSILDAPLEPPASIERTAHQLTGRRVGRWLLTGLLGEGGMSVVYRARSLAPPVGQESAVKLLSMAAATEAGRARFDREIQILIRLRHPAIAPIIDAGVADDGTPWFAMALVDGVDIATWCREQGLDTRQRVDLLLQVCDAVAHAHRHLVIHRDIKPSNVLVDAEGRAILLDFGISRILEEGASDVTGTGLYAFTPRYAAPEQIDGGTITTATDVYSLGSLLHLLLLGTAPQFPPNAPDAECIDPATIARRDGDRALRKTLTGDLGSIIRKTLERGPEHRHAGAAELAADLRAWREGRPVAARRNSGLYRFRRFVARHMIVSGLALALSVSMVVGIVGFAWKAGQERRQAERAHAATIEAETELQRANALNVFILDLFRASMPNRPRDEMPTTNEILELGGQRARDATSAPPAVRTAMLAALGQIHLFRGDVDGAQALSTDALVLARGGEDMSPRVLAEALMLQASIYMSRRDYEAADVAYAEAISVYPANEPPERRMLEMRSDRAVLFNYSGQIERSIEELQALLAESRGRADLPDGFHIRILETLAMNYVSQRRPQDAAPLYEEVLERRAATRDDNQRFYAIALANSAASLSPIGDFRKARQRIEEAVSIYDGIFGDTATHYRAFARLAASQNLMRMGDLPAALQQATLGGEEWARYRGSTPAEDPQHHLYRGRVLASWGRWPEAIEAMRAAIDGYESSGQPLVHFIASAESTLARGLCLGSMAEDGNAVLASLDARVDSGFDPDPVLAAEALEAKAICSFASGQADAAIAHLQALSPMDDAFPAGEAAVVARRRSVRALVLEETGQPGANAARMDAARILDELGIPDEHPWRDSPMWHPRGEVGGDPQGPS